ncbi:MAG: hypothetical protein JHC31_14480 [Sulfurihydrogenibium sp.]|jgi:DNA polymerase III sliding clamp (beta) subunit (PCNA family)|nr:hypothetical protein [Sulfurihydrogenibium sp.]
MKTVVNTRELKKALNRMTFDKKLFDKDICLTAETGTFTIEASTITRGTKETIKANTTEPGFIWVDAEDFIEAVKSLKAKEAELYTEGGYLVIKTDTAQHKISFKNSGYIPKFELLESNKAVLSSSEFLTGLEKLTHIIPKKHGTNFQIDNLLLNFLGRNLEMVAINGFILGMYRVSHSGDLKGKYLIPREDINFIKKALSKNEVLEIYTYQEPNNKANIKLIFKTGNYILSVLAPVYIHYPEIEGLFLNKKDITLTAKLETETIKKIIKELIDTEPNEKKPIIFNFSNKKLIISNEAGYSYTLETETDKELKIAFNGNYLTDIIKPIDTKIFEIDIINKDLQAEIRTNAPYKALISPMNI